METFKFFQGDLPILVSMPHNGIEIPLDIARDMTDSALKVVDTDWYLDRIYQFAFDMGCSIIDPVYSRYVIDLNRPEDNRSLYPGADTTELCPTTQFDQQPIYLPGRKPSGDAIARRVEIFWKPYHQQLARSLKQIQAQFGYALLFEAHSIKSEVPRFFNGKLADFNFGNNDTKSSCRQLTKLIDNWQSEGYSKVVNGRFKGGYITRRYGNPTEKIDSLQLELSQATYLDEASLQYDKIKAAHVITVIETLFKKLKDFCFECSIKGN